MSNSIISPLLERNVNDQLYGYALSSAFRSAWVYDPSYALSRDPDVWEVVRRDAGFLSSFDRHARSVVRPWHVEPPKKAKDEPSKRLAGIIEDGIGHIRGFDAWRRIASEAAFLGRRYGYIESERVYASLDGTPEMDWILPRFVRDIDRRRFRWVAEHGRTKDGQETRRTHLSFFNSVSGSWQPVDASWRSALIEYVFYNSEDRVGYGRGWLEAIYFAHWMKTATIQKVFQGIDKWANGTWIGKVDSLRNASTDRTSTDLRNAMRDVLQTMRSEHIAVLDNIDSIEVIETAGRGHDIAMGFVQYWDEVVERLCNGSIRPTGMGAQKTGARAASETESDTSEAFYQDERDDLDDACDQALIPWFINQNRINLAKLGLIAGTKPPRFHSKQEKRENPSEVAQTAGTLMDRGIPLIRKELYERTNWSMPGPDDDVIQGQKPDPFGGGFGGPGAPPFGKEGGFEDMEQEQSKKKPPFGKDKEEGGKDDEKEGEFEELKGKFSELSGKLDAVLAASAGNQKTFIVPPPAVSINTADDVLSKFSQSVRKLFGRKS